RFRRSRTSRCVPWNRTTPICIWITSARRSSCSRRCRRSACSSTGTATNGACSRADLARRTVAMTKLAPASRWRFWLGAAAVLVLALWLLNDILLPFVVGAVVAYFFDPVVARLQRYGLSRTLATTAVTILAALIAIGAAFA